MTQNRKMQVFQRTRLTVHNKSFPPARGREQVNRLLWGWRGEGAAKTSLAGCVPSVTHREQKFRLCFIKPISVSASALPRHKLEPRPEIYAKVRKPTRATGACWNSTQAGQDGTWWKRLTGRSWFQPSGYLVIMRSLSCAPRTAADGSPTWPCQRFRSCLGVICNF